MELKHLGRVDIEDDTSSFRGRILWAAITANLFANVSLSGVNVALPAIQKSLGLSAVAQVWVSSSLLLATTAAIAPVARLADIWGRRKTAVSGLVLLIVFSAVCALAQNAAWLLSGRVMMGVGLAMIFASTMAMAASVYPPGSRGLVFGYIVSAVYVGLALGPGVCGLLVDLLGWPSLFWLTSAIMVLPFAILVSVRNEWAEARGEKYDYGGAALWIVALSLIFIGLTRLGEPSGRLMTGAGLILGFIFVAGQFKAAKPLTDLRLFVESRRFLWSSLAAFAAYLSAMGSIFLLSLYLQYVKGLSPKEAGFYLMLQPTVQALLTPLAGRLSDNFDPGRLSAAGLILTTAAVLMLSLGLDSETGLTYILVTLGIFGAGFAIFAAPNSNAVMSSVPPAKLGMASGIITATRLAGQIGSLSLTSLVFSLMIGPGQITAEVFPQFLRATKFCFMIFAPACFLGAVICLIKDRKPPQPETRKSINPKPILESAATDV